MDLRFILDTLKAVKLELYRYRLLATVVFILAASGVFAVGYLSPKTYTSNAQLYADVSNILEPLLQGSAEVTSIERVNEAREVIQSRSLLEQVALDSGLLTGAETDQERNRIISRLNNSINLRITGRNFLMLSYSSDSPDQSFDVLSAVLNRFLQKTVTDKRQESRSAYDFIDSQVQTYKRQLEIAENALKEFKSRNLDGSEANVQARIEELRGNIEDLKLTIQETQAQVDLTREQLADESPYREVTVNQGRSDVDTRLANMREQLDSLQLIYHDSHPDIVKLLDQINELEQKKVRGEDTERSGVVTEVIENPVYQDLRLRLASSQTDLQVQRNRLASLERLLQQEYQRAERVAENQAQLKELTRDYNVTMGVYEDMLERRERARLSMSLDMEGQGITYRIQEPASYPTRWEGLQMIEIGLAGPVVGGGLVIGLLSALVLFDNRIRSARTLQTALPEEVLLLASVPHYPSSWKERIFRWDVMLMALMLVLFAVGYAGALVIGVMGIQPEVLIELIRSRLQG